MKEYKEKEIIISEYSFEDWENGIPFLCEPGKIKITNSQTGTYRYTLLPLEQYDLIQEKRELIYNEKIKEELERCKQKFIKQYQASSNKERLLILEIQQYETLFYPEKRPLSPFLISTEIPIKGFNLNSISVNDIRELYENIIVKGNRSYDFMDSPNLPFKGGFPAAYPIFVEAWSKYLDWLKDYNGHIQTTVQQENIDINWIELFLNIDIEKQRKPEVYITTTLENKKNYFSKASFALTFDYLLKFKKETYLFSVKRTLDYINALNLPLPKIGNSGNNVFDQTTFEGKSNYYEFVQSYKNYLLENKGNDDTRFYLSSFVDNEAQLTHDFRNIKREVENHGHFMVNHNNEKIKIYCPELALIFISKELPARNLDTQIETTIDGFSYLETYINGYKEGVKYFSNEFSISPDTLYSNPEPYVRDLHLNFFHSGHKDLTKGWIHVKTQYNIILTHQSVKEYGYYSGIVSKVEDLQIKYPKIFENFGQCDEEITTPKENETISINLKTEKVKENDVLLSSIEDWLFEFRDKMNETDYYILVSALKQYFETGKFPTLKKIIKVNKVNVKVFGWALNQIYRAEKSDTLPKEYLLFAKQNISLFSKVSFDEGNILKSNLYKYFTTKP